MSLLTLVQTACARLGFAQPTAVYTSVDPQIQQFLALANEEGQTLAEMTEWQALTLEATFTTVATEVQGLLATIAPGCKFIVNDTIWNRSMRMPVFGPLSPQNWQQQKAMFYQGPWNQFRIVNNGIHFIPTPVAGQTCAFEYITQNWTSLGFPAYSSDVDVSLLDESVMVLGLIWRFRQAKGLDFTADLQKYQRRVADMVARQTPKPILSLESDAWGQGVATGSGVIGGNGGFMPFS